MSTSPSMTLQRQVEQTPPLHEYGSSIPCASAESSTLSWFLSMKKLRRWPSCTTMTSHWPLPGAAGASRPVRFTRLTAGIEQRSEEHTSELQSLMRISYAVFCLKKKKHNTK